MNQSIYDAAIAQGTSPRLAELLASRNVRIGMTDTKYFAGFKRIGDELGPEHLQSVVTGARQHGYSPSETDVYFPDVARFPGDPQAFVSPAEGRSKIEKVAAMRGMVRDKGAGRSVMKFNYAPPIHDPLENATVADDIVMREVRDMVRANPDVAREPLEKLKSEVRQKRAPAKGRKSNTIRAKV